MKVLVRVTRGDVTTETEVEDVELHQLPHVLLLVRDGWVVSQADIEMLRGLDT